MSSLYLKEHSQYNHDACLPAQIVIISDRGLLSLLLYIRPSSIPTHTYEYTRRAFFHFKMIIELVESSHFLLLALLTNEY